MVQTVRPLEGCLQLEEVRPTGDRAQVWLFERSDIDDPEAATVRARHQLAITLVNFDEIILYTLSPEPFLIFVSRSDVSFFVSIQRESLVTGANAISSSLAGTGPGSDLVRLKRS